MAGLFRDWFPHLTGAQVQDLVFWVRKVGHVAAYAVLTGLTVYASSSTKWLKRRPLLWGALFSLGVALLDEYQQTVLAHRSGTAKDVFIDLIGIILTVSIIKLVSIRRGPTRRDKYAQNKSE